MRQVYKRPKKAAVSLTSLLDLLFVMIFVSLLQQKSATVAKAKAKTPTKKVVEKKVTKVKPAPVKKKVTKFTLSAIFNFHPTAQNPKIPTGTYRMNGSYNSKTGEIYLGGSSWVNRPKNYDMVPLSGKIDNSQAMFTGRIEFQGCKQFTLRRNYKSSTTPISGTWEGVYDCSQGPTGLTLTIE